MQVWSLNPDSLREFPGCSNSTCLADLPCTKENQRVSQEHMLASYGIAMTGPDPRSLSSSLINLPILIEDGSFKRRRYL